MERQIKERGKHGTEIYAAVVVDRDNYQQLSDIIAFLAELGVDIISINRYQYQMVGKKDVFNNGEMKKLLQNLEKIKEGWDSVKTQLVVSAEDFRNDYYNYVFRLKTRCWISFCEIAINPVFLGSVCDTTAFPGRETLRGIDFKLGYIFDYPDFSSYWNNSCRIREHIYSDSCPDCRFCHKLVNVYVEKIYRDYKNGFQIKDQPFCSVGQSLWTGGS